jgi:D-arabinose 1-dehydrogenase-like Zn-dependent alcohol dehydrogenase
MEAYIVEEPGGNFRKRDLTRPTLRPNHVLVRIKASGVSCHLSLFTMEPERLKEVV